MLPSHKRNRGQECPSSCRKAVASKRRAKWWSAFVLLPIHDLSILCPPWRPSAQVLNQSLNYKHPEKNRETFTILFSAVRLTQYYTSRTTRASPEGQLPCGKTYRQGGKDENQADLELVRSSCSHLGPQWAQVWQGETCRWPRIGLC